jgi:hypothetical protein
VTAALESSNHAAGVICDLAADDIGAASASRDRDSDRRNDSNDR